MARVQSSQEKRAAMRTAPEEDPEFQIAPMIDILLVLLVFFMSISSTEVLQANQEVKLPVAKDSKKGGKDAKQSTVNIVWNSLNNVGAIEMDDHKYDKPDDIIPLLMKRLEVDPEMRVYVRADKESRYEYLRQLLIAVGKAHITNVTFAVVDKEVGSPGAGS